MLPMSKSPNGPAMHLSWKESGAMSASLKKEKENGGKNLVTSNHSEAVSGLGSNGQKKGWVLGQKRRYRVFLTKAYAARSSDASVNEWEVR